MPKKSKEPVDGATDEPADVGDASRATTADVMIGTTGPTLSLHLHASRTIVPSRWRYHGHADVVFIVAISAKNVVSDALKQAARTAEVKLSALTSDPVANSLPPDQVVKHKADLAAYVAAADKRFAIVTTQPLKLKSGSEHNNSAMPVFTAFELPTLGGSLNGTFHIEIMAVDLHKEQSRRQLEQLFNRPPPSLLAEVREHVSQLEGERLKEVTKLTEFVSTSIDRVVGGLLSAARAGVTAAAPAAVPSLAIVEHAFKDIHTIIAAYRKARIVSDVLGGNLVIAGTFCGRGSRATLSFAQPAVKVADGKVQATTVDVQRALAAENGSFNMLSSTLVHWFGHHNATAEVETTVVVSANL